jgi:flavin-dependent dehydrogenase
LLSSVDVLVIGAGPTGLGAAKRLNQIVSLYIPSIVVSEGHRRKKKRGRGIPKKAGLIDFTEQRFMDDH